MVGQLFNANGGSKGARKAKLSQERREHKNSPFSKILQRGDQVKVGQKEGRL